MENQREGVSGDGCVPSPGWMPGDVTAGCANDGPGWSSSTDSATDAADGAGVGAGAAGAGAGAGVGVGAGSRGGSAASGATWRAAFLETGAAPARAV